jgi:tRNA-dihydrouridine synthase 3
MLEWCSFLSRYIPVGLLERLPQRINERPPPFFGRDDLETLMASQSASDWIKLSEMILGPAHKDLHFVPKHRSNSYAATIAESKAAHIASEWG